MDEEMMKTLLIAKEDSTKLKILAGMIINNARLNYNGSELTIGNDEAILQCIKEIYPEEYKSNYERLKAEKEAKEKDF